MRGRGRFLAGMKVSSRGWCPHSLQETGIVSPFTRKRNTCNKISCAGDKVVF